MIRRALRFAGATQASSSTPGIGRTALGGKSMRAAFQESILLIIAQIAGMTYTLARSAMHFARSLRAQKMSAE